MAHLDGSADIPVNQMWSRVASGYRKWLGMADLRDPVIAHFASIWPTVTSEMVHHGVSRLETLGSMVQALVRGRGTAERQEVLADLGANAEGLTRDMHSRWRADDSIAGHVSALANTFMKYIGVH
jgi:hypothetical protein